jgi:hypothetical protein
VLGPQLVGEAQRLGSADPARASVRSRKAPIERLRVAYRDARMDDHTSFRRLRLQG